MDDLRSNSIVTRADLERAAAAVFDNLTKAVDRPRYPVGRDPDRALADAGDASREAVAALEAQLRRNLFDQHLDPIATMIAQGAEVDLDQLAKRDENAVFKLAARVERLLGLYFQHQIDRPWTRFEPDDDLVRPDTSAVSPGMPERVVGPLEKASLSLGEAAEQYLKMMAARGLGQSHLDEVGRALGWLREAIPSATALHAVTKDAALLHSRPKATASCGASIGCPDPSRDG